MQVLSVSIAAAAAVSFFVPAHADVRVAPQAAIDHANSGGIRDWHAENSSGVYLRDRTNRWYYASFRHGCPGVLTNPTIAFNTYGDHRFDRSASVITATETCAVESVTVSPAPAAKGGPALR